MANLATITMESQVLATEFPNGIGNAPAYTFVTSPVYQGTYAVQATFTATNSFAIRDFTPAGAPFFVRMGFYITVSTPPSGTIAIDILRVLTVASANISILRLVIDTAGVVLLRLFNAVGGTVQVGGSFTLSKDVWHLIDWRGVVSATTGELELSVDGVSVALGTGLNTGTANAGRFNYVPSGTLSGLIGSMYLDQVLIEDLPIFLGPSLVGVSAAINVTATSGTDLVPAFPASYTAVAEDVAVVLVHHSSNGPFNTPSNYVIATDGIETLDDNNTSAQRVTVFWDRLVGGESAPTLILTTDTSTAVRGAILFIVRGCRTTGTPFEVCKRLLNAAAATISFPAVTTSIANALLLALGAYEDDPSARTTPTNWTAGAIFVSSLGADMSLNYFTRALAVAGTAIAFTTTVSGGTFANSPSVGAVLAFVPPPTGPTDNDSLAMMPSRQLIMWP